VPRVDRPLAGPTLSLEIPTAQPGPPRDVRDSSTGPVGQTAGGGWLRRNAQLAVGLLISCWSIWQLATTVSLTEVARYLGGANPWLLIFCVLSVPVTMLLKALRWRYLFAARQQLELKPLLSALYIGYLMNTVLPARVGEIVRAYLVGRDPRVGTATAIGTIVLEKVLDLTTLAIILAMLVLTRQLPPLPEWMATSALISSVLITSGVVVLGGMVMLRRLVLQWVTWLEQRVALLQRLALATFVGSILDGLAALGRRDVLPGLLLWSVATWVLATLSIWSGIAGVGIATGLDSALLVLVVTNLGMAVPSAPGYVGPYHYLVVESLAPFGVDRNQAVGAAVIIHAIVFGNFIVGGLLCLWRTGQSLGGLRNAARH
jgi:glycosyltransferase 2 family protein